MIKMYRCPCYEEMYTEEEYRALPENENCHKYCARYDCYENPNDFELYFKKLYTGFHETLQKKYPDLTSNEIRLCALLKLEMNTKEISSITFQSIRAIETARLRLRKKLGIPRDINLNNFCVKL